MKQFKVGDRVRYFWAEDKVTTVTGVAEILHFRNDIAEVKIIKEDCYFKSGETTYFHVKQLRRCKPKKKRVKKTVEITRDDLAKAWLKIFNHYKPDTLHESNYFNGLCKSLGIDVEE